MFSVDIQSCRWKVWWLFVLHFILDGLFFFSGNFWDLFAPSLWMHVPKCRYFKFHFDFIHYSYHLVWRNAFFISAVTYILLFLVIILIILPTVFSLSLLSGTLLCWMLGSLVISLCLVFFLSHSPSVCFWFCVLGNFLEFIFQCF